MDLSNKAPNLRKKLGADGESPIDIFKLVQKIENLTLVFYGLGKNIIGVCYKGT
ncbi:zinc metallopeptidase [Streptococcus pneumoniae]|nr:zinc metallopeptidase [Streptococcus pneumoniae]VOJ30207.1 zinc metallopeptidase [Streptococcus pneumoniae]VOJ66863.1 zinc metallopeptidase [Streptococcus pneumoniae]